MIIVFIILIGTILCVLASPVYAFAWGPGTHLQIGRDIIESISLTAPSAAAIITKYRYDFLYGNISADIIVGKNFAAELEHCHNWNVAFRLKKMADTPAKVAFVYGYLCHLAADTAAHNLFIPTQMVRAFSTRILRHIYWELRFDGMSDRGVWHIPEKIAAATRKENNSLLDAALRDTLFSFRVNKRIFSSIIMLHRVEKWHKMIALLSSRSRWQLDRNEWDSYYRLSLAASADLLSCGENARCILRDPRGKAKIADASRVRKKLKKMKRNGQRWETLMIATLDRYSMAYKGIASGIAGR